MDKRKKGGYYTEIFFTKKDVRYIATNDSVDSAKSDNDFTPFRNLFNDFYARDTQEAIIDESIWARVQELRENRRRPTKAERQGFF